MPPNFKKSNCGSETLELKRKASLASRFSWRGGSDGPPQAWPHLGQDHYLLCGWAGNTYLHLKGGRSSGWFQSGSLWPGSARLKLTQWSCYETGRGKLGLASPGGPAEGWELFWCTLRPCSKLRLQNVWSGKSQCYGGDVKYVSDWVVNRLSLFKCAYRAQESHKSTWRESSS